MPQKKPHVTYEEWSQVIPHCKEAGATERDVGRFLGLGTIGSNLWHKSDLYKENSIQKLRQLQATITKGEDVKKLLKVWTWQRAKDEFVGFGQGQGWTEEGLMKYLGCSVGTTYKYKKSPDTKLHSKFVIKLEQLLESRPR